jgi:hypothetical protein
MGLPSVTPYLVKDQRFASKMRWFDEGAKFWLRVINEFRDRGVADILIAVVNGLKGFPEAINAVFPMTQVLGLRRQHRRSAMLSAPIDTLKLNRGV